MEKKCIKIGGYNKAYNYIILAIIFSILKDFLLGTSKEAVFQENKAFDGGDVSSCFLAREAICYLFTIILSIVLYYIRRKISGEDELNESSKKLDDNLIKEKPSGEIELIHNEQESVFYHDFKILFFIFLWILEEESLSYIKNVFLNLDFWMLELIALHFLMIKILKMKVYKHQKIMLWFCGVPCLLKIVTIIFSFIDTNNSIPNVDENKPDKYKYSDNIDKLKILYVVIPWSFLFGFILYSIFILLHAYINTKIKWLIDLKYISSNKIFVIYSFMGFGFCTLISLIAGFFQCASNTSNYTIIDYFCNVRDGNNQFLDNLYFYITNLNKIEIVNIFIGMIFFAFYKFFCLRVIESLTPIHLIFSYPIYYVFNKIYLFVLNYIKTGSCFLIDMNYALEKLILDYSSDFVSILGYLVYLEIIELHFCGLDYNIRRTILERDILDMEENKLNKSVKSGNDSVVENTSNTGSFSEEPKSSNEKDISFEK